jgi:spermidine/putrescine transport system ATP-binding protein
MHNGEIIQKAPPQEVYSKPADRFVAQFVGEMNFIKAEVGRTGEIQSPLGPIRAPIPNGLSAGSAVTLAVRPEHVKVSALLPADVSSNVGKITSKNYLGDAALLEVEVKGVNLIAKLAGDCELAIGSSAMVEIPAHRWHVFP